MTRNRQSAKTAGTRFERQIADYLARTIDDRIDRRARTGNHDRGDITGVRLSPALGGGRVVIECKNTTRMALGTWQREAQLEAGNDDAVTGVTVHKRHGNGDPSAQWVTMTLSDLAALLTGHQPDDQQVS